MKFYDCSTAPSPRRVRIFLAEKGIEILTVEIDLAGGEQFSDAFLRLNPRGTVPVLVLEDGTAISEASAICRYIEAAYPEPRLMGRTPAEQGIVAMWDHYCEQEGFFAAAEALRNAARRLEGHALTGRDGYPQIPALVERGRTRVQRFLASLDERLAGSRYVAGEQFTIADITALVTVDFAARLRLPLPDASAAARRWYEEINARPSTTG